MNFLTYLKDKLLETIVFITSYLLTLLLLIAFKTNKALIIAYSLITLISYITIITINYMKKRKFYNTLLNNIKHLDKAYLVLETINEPSFYEGQLTFNAMYEINKSMIEYINKLNSQINDFKNYIEMWIHEVKIPLSCLMLYAHNNKDKHVKVITSQIKKIDDYLEQVLYYTRSENASNDYFINKTSLKKVVNNVLVKNKDYILENNIELKVEDLNHFIYTDSKWLEFILNQIINNSIKYKDNKKDSYIRIYTETVEDKISLIIKDNGIGIIESDIKRVFDKTFTGSNGRNNASSTGMGLFIAKNLCNKLGHQINIESIKDEYTLVSIVFSKNKYYEVVN